MSKRRSGSRSEQRLRESPIFFLDRSIGRKKLADALRGAGVTVVVHDELFAPTTRDEVWLAKAGAENWLVLTCDRLIERPIERLTVAQANVRVVIVRRSRDMTGDQMAAMLVRKLAEIRHFCHEHPPPFVAYLTRSRLRMAKGPGTPGHPDAR